MAYEKYNTDALVCGNWDRNTSDKFFLLFTNDFGMVKAVARSVREERSKQRFSLQDFSLSRLSLVPGRSSWYVAGAEVLSNQFMATDNRARRTFMHNIMQFLNRFVAYEVAQKQIFNELVNICCFSETMEIDYNSVQAVCLFRWLYYLGYIEADRAYKAVLNAPSSLVASRLLKPETAELIRLATAEAHYASHL